MFFINFFYISWNIFNNYLFYTFTFKINYQSIYLLSSLNDFQLSYNILNIFNLEISDFYQYAFLDFFINLKIFFCELYLNYLNYPIFILFAVLFFLTSFFSLLALSYLGFYGVFILNFVTLFLL